MGGRPPANDAGEAWRAPGKRLCVRKVFVVQRLCALLSTSVIPSPRIDSSPPSRPLIARIRSSMGPATTGPSPAFQSASVASTLSPLNNLCPGKNRLGHKSLATRTNRLSGTLRFSFNGRRISKEWITMSLSIDSDDSPRRCVRVSAAALKSSRSDGRATSPRRRASLAMNRLIRNPLAIVPTSTFGIVIVVSLTICPTTSRTRHSLHKDGVSHWNAVRFCKSSSRASRSEWTSPQTSIRVVTIGSFRFRDRLTRPRDRSNTSFLRCARQS